MQTIIFSWNKSKYFLGIRSHCVLSKKFLGAENLRLELHSLYILLFKYKSNHGCQTSQENPPFPPTSEWTEASLLKLTHSTSESMHGENCLELACVKWCPLFQGNKLKMAKLGMELHRLHEAKSTIHGLRSTFWTSALEPLKGEAKHFFKLSQVKS